MKNIISKIFRDKILKETVWSFLTKGSALVLFFILNIVLVRKLGVEAFGTWSLFLSVITLLFTLSYFGINASTKKFVAQYNDTNNLRNILLSSIKLRFIFSFSFSVILLLSHKYIAILLGNQDLEILFLYGIPLLFLSGFSEYLKSVFMGLHRIKYNFILNICEFGFKLLLVILFLFFSNSIISIINSFTLALLITTACGLYLLYFNFYKDLQSTDGDFKKQILKFSYPLVFISLGFIALTEIDTIMIGFFSTTSEVGIYSVAKQIITKLPHIALAVSMGAMPIFAKLNQENKEELRRKFNFILKINTGIYAVIVLVLLTLSPMLIPLIFGSEYIHSVVPLQILSLYLFLVATSLILNSFLDYVGKVKIRAYNIILTIVLNIVLNVILIPRYGAVGAALATLISYLPYIVFNWFEVAKVFATNR